MISTAGTLPIHLPRFWEIIRLRWCPVPNATHSSTRPLCRFPPISAGAVKHLHVLTHAQAVEGARLNVHRSKSAEVRYLGCLCASRMLIDGYRRVPSRPSRATAQLFCPFERRHGVAVCSFRVYPTPRILFWERRRPVRLGIGRAVSHSFVHVNEPKPEISSTPKNMFSSLILDTKNREMSPPQDSISPPV